MNKSTAIILAIGGLVLGLIVGYAGGIYVVGKSQKGASTVSELGVTGEAPAEAPTSKVPETPSTSTTPSEAVPEIKEIGIQLTDTKLEGITSPVTVQGKANVFEGHVNLRLKDANGKVLGTSFATACMGEVACPFEGEISFSTPTTKTGTIEAYTQDAATGKETDLVSIPVTFAGVK